jgi:phage shock protein PspC (stress-responsive transcriptional regulator)
MKKVININFQGRVIPIEETAYESLKQYVESLRRYFANEEGRDEIINDIEGRIAELFSERLKKGATCITDADVESVIASMGRPEELEAQEAELGATTPNSGTYSGTGSTGSQHSYSYTQAETKRSFSRNSDDKILGGVCSGIANYFGIDPVIMRIIFVLLFGALFWVYLLLWVIVPARSMQSNITKRLFRNPDDKVIAGVSGGLAAYFNIDTWIPRLIFALPFVLALISGTFNAFWWDFDYGFGPRIISGSLGSTMFVTYIILWIVVPKATTAADKLEMKGERVNLNTIRDTVKEDLESFKSRAKEWGSEVKESAQNIGAKAKEMGSEAGTRAQAFASEAAPVARRTGRGIGHVIGILFKAFFLFIAGVIALALFGALIGMIWGGFAVFPIKNFILEGFWQNFMAYTALFLFLGIPVIALITWLIRRIAGYRSKNHYLGFVFGGLWTIGLIALIFLVASVGRNFRTRSAIQEKISTFQPAGDKLNVMVEGSNVSYYGDDWFGIENNDDFPFYGINQDTLMMNTVRVNIAKSPDSNFHIYKVKFGRGSDPRRAREIAEKISFEMTMKDSTLVLPKGFAISEEEKFRNQQVLVVIEVPVGKKIEVDDAVNDFSWFNVSSSRRGWNVNIDDNWDNNYSWQTDVEYIMTPDGLQRLSDLDQKELKNGRFKIRINEHGVDIQGEGELKDVDTSSNYRYKKDVEIKLDSATIKVSGTSARNTEAEGYDETSSNNHSDLGMPMVVFSRLFQ